MGGSALSALLSNGCTPNLVITSPLDRLAAPVYEALSGRTSHPEVVTATRLGNGDSLRERLSQCSIGVCAAWAERLQEDVLMLPKNGWLNLHPSILPQWRGGDPISWQLATMVKEIGCSVHTMTEEFDSGQVLAASRVATRQTDTRSTVQRRIGAELGRLASLLVRGKGVSLTHEPCFPVGAEYSLCPPLGAKLALQPEQLTVKQGMRLSRAFSPRPGVYVLCGSRHYCVAALEDPDWSSIPSEDAPGSVVGGNGMARITFSDGTLIMRLVEETA